MAVLSIHCAEDVECTLFTHLHQIFDERATLPLLIKFARVKISQFDFQPVTTYSAPIYREC